MVKELLKLIDGTEKEFTIQPLRWQVVKNLKSKFIKIDEIVPEGNGIKAMRGNFDYEGLSGEVISKCILGERSEDIDAFEVDRIYNKYFAKYFNPNHQDNAEKKSSPNLD